MCRLFGQISIQSSPATHGLLEAPYSLFRQSNADLARLQKDGWGIAYYNGAHGAHVDKSPKPAFEEQKRFARLAQKTRSRIFIAHLRAASNPKGLPFAKLIGPDNSQPFSWGDIVFAHNGTVEIPDEVARFLGAYRKRLRGANDSEVYFWQFMKFLDAYGDIPEALQACVREIWGLWRACRTRYPQKKKPYTGLNTLVSNGHSLHAMCHYPNSTWKALLNSNQPWGQMSWSQRHGHVIIASENLDHGQWEKLKDGEIVSVHLKGRILSIKRKLFSAQEHE